MRIEMGFSVETYSVCLYEF